MADQDSRGLPISTASPKAAERYRLGIDLLLSAWPGSEDAFLEALAHDPDFALAHAALARLHAIRGDVVEARARIALAHQIASQSGTPREASHASTLSLAINGPSTAALRCALAHVNQWPRDALILSLPLGAFGLLAFSGMANHDQARVDLCEQLADEYDRDDWWFLTYRGWSLAENGAVSQGRDLAERALELRRDNANAAHAVSHAMFEEGAMEEAEKLLGAWLPRYDRTGVLHGHLAWHAALSALERDDDRRALEIYTEHIQPSVSRGLPINVVTDSVSLLWRMSAYGYDVPASLWSDAASYAEARYPSAAPAFVEAHLGLLSASTGQRAAAIDRIDANIERIAQGTLPAGPIVSSIGMASLAFTDGDYSECTRILRAAASDVACIGGSGAQREIFEDMLLIAEMRNGETLNAKTLLDERLHRRPSRRDERWRHQIGV